ncbi:MAG: hypothetical protein WC421_02885 [Elusimicrobiales bacterium]
MSKHAPRCAACHETLTPFTRSSGNGHRRRGNACLTPGCKSGLWYEWANLKDTSDRIAKATAACSATQKKEYKA